MHLNAAPREQISAAPMRRTIARLNMWKALVSLEAARATAAFLFPRRGLSRYYWARRVLFFLQVATQASGADDMVTHATGTHLVLNGPPRAGEEILDTGLNKLLGRG